MLRRRRPPRPGFRRRVVASGLPWWAFLVVGVLPLFQSRRLLDPEPASNDVVWGAIALVVVGLCVAAAVVARAERDRPPDPEPEPAADAD